VTARSSVVQTFIYPACPMPFSFSTPIPHSQHYCLLLQSVSPKHFGYTPPPPSQLQIPRNNPELMVNEHDLYTWAVVCLSPIYCVTASYKLSWRHLLDRNVSADSMELNYIMYVCLCHSVKLIYGVLVSFSLT